MALGAKVSKDRRRIYFYQDVLWQKYGICLWMVSGSGLFDKCSNEFDCNWSNCRWLRWISRYFKMGVALSGGRLRCLAWRNVACYGNIDFIWNIEYSWREEGGDCTDDSRSIRKLAGSDC